jgi:hypothetical protein
MHAGKFFVDQEQVGIRSGQEKTLSGMPDRVLTNLVP